MWLDVELHEILNFIGGTKVTSKYWFIVSFYIDLYTWLLLMSL